MPANVLPPHRKSPNQTIVEEKHHRLAKQLIAQGNFEECISVCKEAISRDPDDWKSGQILAKALHNTGGTDRAIGLLDHICQRTDVDVVCYHDLATLLRLSGNLLSCQSVLAEALRRFPAHAPTYRFLGSVLILNNFGNQAVMVLSRGIKLQNNDWSLWFDLGRALALIDQPEEALKKYDRAWALRNKVAVKDSIYYEPTTEHTRFLILLSKAHAYQHLGRADDAARILRSVLKKDPKNANAWYELSSIIKFSANSPELPKMQEILERNESTFSDLELEYIYFALGKAWMDCKIPDKAMKYLDKANYQRKKTFNYDHNEIVEQISRISDFYPKELFENTKIEPNEEEPLMVFIVGMPRCGSTLLEQSLSMHPDIYGAGELSIAPRLRHEIFGRNFPESSSSIGEASDLEKLQRFHNEYFKDLKLRLTNEGKEKNSIHKNIIIDKMLGNYISLGIIAQAIPNSKVIHCRRNPVDTCLSCYSKRYSEGHHYTYDQENLARVYNSYIKLMEHWRQSLPRNYFMEIDYERLVADHEGETRKVLDFLNLPWNDDILAFHKSSRSVRTASLSQVRQPIYDSSVERWKPYAPYIKPMLEALGIKPI
ncbi:sulfotransferase [Thalassospiraceae bacterium SW-3-3]|nr:sulfotransferase [Thalassospiraceae bacterium SW-3-3]